MLSLSQWTATFSAGLFFAVAIAENDPCFWLAWFGLLVFAIFCPQINAAIARRLFRIFR